MDGQNMHSHTCTHMHTNIHPHSHTQHTSHALQRRDFSTLDLKDTLPYPTLFQIGKYPELIMVC